MRDTPEVFASGMDYITRPLELDGTASMSGSKSVVYQGRMEKGTKVAVKILRCSPLDVAGAIKVCRCHILQARLTAV